MSSWNPVIGALAALLVLGGAASGQIRFWDEPYYPTGDPVEKNPDPNVVTKLPELKPVRRPLTPLPGNAVLDGATNAPADAELARLGDARVVLIDAVRAERRVGDLQAITATMRRLELLRQERLDRIRRLEPPRIKKPERREAPGAPSEEQKPVAPVLEMPVAPKRAGDR